MLGIDLLPLYRQERADHELMNDEDNIFPAFKEWKRQYESEYTVRMRLSEDVTEDELTVEVGFSCDFDAGIEAEDGLETHVLEASAF